MEGLGNEFMRRLRLVKKSRPEGVKKALERLVERRPVPLSSPPRSLRLAG